MRDANVCRGEISQLCEMAPVRIHEGCETKMFNAALVGSLYL